MTTQEFEPGLDESLSSTLTPEWAEVCNLLASRWVRLGDLLGVPSWRYYLRPGGRAGEASRWLIVEGAQGHLAQVGIPKHLLELAGLAEGQRAEVADAVIAQHLAPAMPGLRAFFSQQVRVRLAAHDKGDSKPWAHVVTSYFCSDGVITVPIRLHTAYVPLLRKHALAAETSQRLEPHVPLFIGHQMRLTPSDLLSLECADVLVPEAAEPDETGLFLEGRPRRRESARLAVVNCQEGQVLHRTPSDDVRLRMAQGGGGRPRIAADIVVGRLTVPHGACRRLAPGEAVPGWEGVNWLACPELRIAGQLLALLKDVHVAGHVGFEIASFAKPAQRA